MMQSANFEHTQTCILLAHVTKKQSLSSHQDERDQVQLGECDAQNEFEWMGYFTN